MAKKAKAKDLNESRTLSFDPGAKNFAYAFAINKQIVETGLLDTSSNAAFLNSVVDLLVRLKPNNAVLERYMYRGASSTDSEVVNQLIGRLEILTNLYCGVEICKITASQWKLWYKKKLGKAKGAKFSSLEVFPDAPVEHIADASCIENYFENYWLENPKNCKR